MKRRIFAALLAVVFLFSGVITAFAASPEIAFDASYDSDTGVVTVSIYVINAIGVEAADLCLAYDESVFEFRNAIENQNSGELMIIADKSPLEEGLCTCSFFFTESCGEGDLDDDGHLQLASYTFKPINDKFDVNDFCLWAGSFDLSSKGNIVSSIKPQGDTSKKEMHTRVVTAYDKDNADAGSNSDQPSRWYVYVIAGVLAVVAIAGIALIAVKSGRDDFDDEETDDSAAKPVGSETDNDSSDDKQ